MSPRPVSPLSVPRLRIFDRLTRVLLIGRSLLRGSLTGRSPSLSYIFADCVLGVVGKAKMGSASKPATKVIIWISINILQKKRPAQKRMRRKVKERKYRRRKTRDDC